MSLLTTRMRDVKGRGLAYQERHHRQVGNESQGWSRAVIDYPVPYGEDLARIRQLMEQAAGGMFRERGWRELMLEKPEMWGRRSCRRTEDPRDGYALVSCDP
jgi:moderate conductance mechanosensitive channel